MKITTGKYAGQTGTIEANVYQRTVDYPSEFNNGHHVTLDTEELVTVHWEQVETQRESRAFLSGQPVRTNWLSLQ